MSVSEGVVGLIGLFGFVCVSHAAMGYAAAWHGDHTISLLFNAVAMGEAFCGGIMVQKAAACVENIASGKTFDVPVIS